MYIFGFIKTDNPGALIDPKPCPTIEDLFDAITNFFNEEDYKLDSPITIERLESSLKEQVPVRINIEGHKVAVLLGETDVIKSNTDKFLHLD